ncbi:MAG TPA: alpha-amylase family glycosyl hydrolase [Bacteroidota bacterium]|nr:alpha-amylase family glycosyl hydrolase [Bacteroidota bacterium]
MEKTSRYQARSSPEWVRRGIIYEIYPRAFSADGTFAAIQKRLSFLKKLGVTILWLMPIHPIGKLKRKGTLGSPYSVSDYYAVNPEFGTIDDLRSLVAAAHSLGFHIIMDLVLGHTSWDSVLMSTHPEWFKRSNNGKIISPDPIWTDVAALDYTHKGLRKYMTEMMKYWIAEIGFDGFRCDDAGRVPLGFWEEARKGLDAIKSVLMISETDTRPSHHKNAFDLTYSSLLFRSLIDVANDKAPARKLRQLLARERKSYPRDSLLMRFSSNHDRNVIEGPDVDIFGDDAALLAALTVTTLSGIPLLYNGQEIGNRKRLSLFEKTSIRWNDRSGFIPFYASLFSLRRKFRAFSHGELAPLRTSHDGGVFAFARLHSTEGFIVISNWTTKKVNVALNLSPLQSKKKKRTRLTEVSPGKNLALNAGVKDSIEIELPKLGWKILRMKMF